ncbi:hypothetical protein SAMN02745163_02561 [Clostridium cavendishii DSM 21758]|uniref:ABC-2 family transporter protein n=1 Tax=Clostridium cavendishii DSM 21758 TaxID=1121302 RepID=A0A1M6M1B5_9CLOT|nr:hypothetical protein [Clostridium cavendishii]SHJ77238.1 hypothetical protein SAMN02745163_02561 [Clostridium cavendishii DSM 21758]
MEVFKYELFKMFSRKGPIIALISLIVFINGFTFFMIGNNKNISYEELKSYEGDVVNYRENIDKIFNNLEIAKESNNDKNQYLYNYLAGVYSLQGKSILIAISDFAKIEENPFKDIEGRYRGGNTFDFRAYEVESLKEKLEMTKKKGQEQTYEYKNENKAYNMYNKVLDRKVYFVEGWNLVNNQSQLFEEAFIIVVIILLGVSPMFSAEYKQKIAPIILATKNGRKVWVISKFLVASIYSIFVVIVTKISSLIIAAIIYGLRNGNAPIQCLDDYSISPYKFSIIEFWLINLIICILGAIILSVLILLVSNKVKSSMITFIVLGSLAFVPIFIKEFFGIRASWGKAIVNLSINKFILPNNIFEYYYSANILGRPVIYPMFMIIYGVVLLIVLVFLLIRSIENKSCFIGRGKKYGTITQ